MVVSVRYQEDIISVWNRSCGDKQVKQRIQCDHALLQPPPLALTPRPPSDTIRRVLQLPTSTLMEYKNHDASIKDNSSFRNTEQHVGAYKPPARRGEAAPRPRDRDREAGGEGSRSSSAAPEHAKAAEGLRTTL